MRQQFEKETGYAIDKEASYTYAPVSRYLKMVDGDWEEIDEAEYYKAYSQWLESQVGELKDGLNNTSLFYTYLSNDMVYLERPMTAQLIRDKQKAIDNLLTKLK